MSDQAFDPATTYLVLEADNVARRVPVHDSLWQDLMSGDPQTEGARLIDRSDGRLFSAYDMDRDWDHWEMHPDGDEVLVLLSGRMIIHWETPDGERREQLFPGRAFVVPKGTWHTAQVPEASRLLAITPGKGTRHRPVK